MPFLVSDIISDVYVPKHQFVIINVESVWTCYIPRTEKQHTLQEGQKLYSDKSLYVAYKAKFESFINTYDERFESVVEENGKFTAGHFKQFVELCKEAEAYQSYTQHFYTDAVSSDKDFESDFGALKMRGRALLNDQYFSAGSYLARVVKRVAEATTIEPRSLYLYAVEEIWDLLDGKKAPSPDPARRAAFIAYLDKGKKVILTGSDAEAAARQFLGTYKAQKDLTGTIANKGKAVGSVRVFDQGYKHTNISEFVDAMGAGEILVAETTSPEIVAACQKAAAIVTNQGGLLSHAAIISRELGIPCIVGGEGATQTLKDGDLVEVDANAGVVRVLERAK